MNKTILVACFVGFLLNCLSLAYADEPTLPAPYIPDGTRNTEPSEGKLKGQTLRIKRPLLMVTDLKRSLDFYENVVGLEVYSVDQVYYTDQTTIGNKLFNTPPGTYRRLAQLNTSTEVRGLALREINADFEVPKGPRIGTILFEADDTLAIIDRAAEAGAEVIGPSLGVGQPRGNQPGSRVMEVGIVDPDGHVLAFFRYFEHTEEGDAEWEAVKKKYKLESLN